MLLEQHSSRWALSVVAVKPSKFSLPCTDTQARKRSLVRRNSNDLLVRGRHSLFAASRHHRAPHTLPSLAGPTST